MFGSNRNAEKLDSIRIASPCRARWEAMAGDDRVRFCQECRLHVYNLSAMDLDEAAELISRKDERVCVRFYRRQDGTVLTQDCPVGLRAVQRRYAAARAAGLGAIAASAIALFGWAALAMRPTMGAPVVGRPARSAPDAPARDAAWPWPDGRNNGASLDVPVYHEMPVRADWVTGRLRASKLRRGR